MIIQINPWADFLWLGWGLYMAWLVAKSIKTTRNPKMQDLQNVSLCIVCDNGNVLLNHMEKIKQFARD